MDAALSTLLPSKNPLRHRDYFLYSLNDTFILDFSQRKPRFIVIIEQAVEPLPFFQVFFDARKDCLVSPYTGAYTILSILLHLLFSWILGSVLAWIEGSTLPVHKGTRNVVLRLLKIITPVKCVIPCYDDHVCFPKEGELHKKRVFAQPHPWTINIDKPSVMTRALFNYFGINSLFNAVQSFPFACVQQARSNA